MNKDNHIKVRVTDKQRELAYKNAKKLNMNVSQYLRFCISMDYPDLIRRLPESIDTSNLLNKIFCQLEGHTDTDTLEQICNTINNYFNTGKGDFKND